MEFTLHSTLGALLDHPQARAIIDRVAPGIAANPMIAIARGMSLDAILATPHALQFGVTKERVETVLDEINQRIR